MKIKVKFLFCTFLLICSSIFFCSSTRRLYSPRLTSSTSSLVTKLEKNTIQSRNKSIMEIIEYISSMQYTSNNSNLFPVTVQSVFAHIFTVMWLRGRDNDLVTFTSGDTALLRNTPFSPIWFSVVGEYPSGRNQHPTHKAKGWIRSVAARFYDGG